MINIKRDEYPLNLFRIIKRDGSYTPDYPRDEWTQTIDLMFDRIRGMNQRKIDIIKLRFIDNLTLSKIGDKYGITLEGVRVIINDVVRKMRHPEISAIMDMGYNNYINLESEESLLDTSIYLIAGVPFGVARELLYKHNIKTVQELLGFIGTDRNYNMIPKLRGVGDSKFNQFKDAIEKYLSKINYD